MRMLRRTTIHLSSVLLAGASCAFVHAAELGEARVASHMGQQLVADIELAMLEDPAQTVQARVASPEVYNGAGIALPDVLATLHLSVMRRDGRQFLHVTSLRPVEADHVHLYLELTDKGQRSVRLATLWLTPNPEPAPAPAPVAPPPVVTAPAGPVVAPLAASLPAPVPPPRMEAPRPAAVVAPPARPRPVPVPVAPPPRPKPAILPALRAPAEPATCVQAPQEAQACVALGEKNALLRSQLGRLEQKVQGLQASLGAAKPADVQAPPPGPKPISAIKPLVPRKPKAPPPDDGLPWGWIGGGLGGLAILGVALILLGRRRRRSRNVDIPAEPGALAKLLARVRGRKSAAAEDVEATEAGVAEPTLE